MNIRLTLEKMIGTLLSSRSVPSGENMQVPLHARSAVSSLVKGEKKGMVLYKEGERLKWAAVYSNNFRDNDYPVREIISAQSHRNFSKLVELGLASPPDFWIWHEVSLKIGDGEWVAVDEHDIDGNDIVFAIAGGTIDSGREELALALDMVPEKALSHGMPYWSVMYSDIEPDLILGHITTEVSWLPVEVAANKLTAGMTNVYKERPNMVDQSKLKQLIEAGVSKELLDQLVEQNSQIAKSALESEMQHKEVSTEVVEEETEAVDIGDAAVAEVQPDVEMQPEEETAEEDAVPPVAVAQVSMQELVAVFSGITKLMAEQNVAIKALGDEVSKLKEEAATEKAVNTPMLSFVELMKNSKSVVGSDEAAIDGRSSLARSAPQEAETKQTPNQPFIFEWMGRQG